MINITKEQLKELEGIYQMSHGCKDRETKKLAKAIFKSIEFIDLEKYSIDTGWVFDGYYKEINIGERRNLITLPIIVILYLITKDDKYLKGSKYVKGTVTKNKKVRSYIKFANTYYFIDNLYAVCKLEDIFK